MTYFYDQYYTRKKLTHYHTMPHFDALKIAYIAVENIVREREIACNKQFLLFPQCSLPCMALIFHFKCTLKCRLQFVLVWISLKFCRLVMGQNNVVNGKQLDTPVFSTLSKNKSYPISYIEVIVYQSFNFQYGLLLSCGL